MRPNDHDDNLSNSVGENCTRSHQFHHFPDCTADGKFLDSGAPATKEFSIWCLI